MTGVDFSTDSFLSNESLKMASLVPKNKPLLNYADQAPAPQKDFCQILVTHEQVIFRWWKISLRANAKALPGEIKDSHDDFLYDEKCHSEIHRVFGKTMLDYVVRLANGEIDYLPRLPRHLLIHIIRFIGLQDISNLARTCKLFYELCNGNDLWEQVYHDHSETSVTDDLRSLADGLGWKKLFFTNKLQLQMQLRRQARKKTEAIATDGNIAFLTEGSTISENGEEVEEK